MRCDLLNSSMQTLHDSTAGAAAALAEEEPEDKDINLSMKFLVTHSDVRNFYFSVCAEIHIDVMQQRVYAGETSLFLSICEDIPTRLSMNIVTSIFVDHWQKWAQRSQRQFCFRIF